MSLQGKTALVTGGGRGIGASIALRLAADGANIAITYSRSAEAAETVAAACREKGVEAEAVQADSGNAKDAAGLVDRIVERFGGLDILVNNAGVLSSASLEETTDEEFDSAMNVNIRGVFVVSRSAARVMGEGGRIINIGSIFGESIPVANLGLYTMSKFAVAGLTRAWARDLGPKGITVNCVQPGPVDTDMNPAQGAFADILTPRTALGRYGKPEEIAELVAFLAGPQSSYLTGACLNVDGGTTA